MVLEPRVSSDFVITWSLTPRWPLTPHLLRSHAWLYPSIIVFICHGNTSVCGYHDPLNKSTTKRSMTPKWPLTRFLLPSHAWLYQCTIRSLCPSPMQIYEVCGYNRKTSTKMYIFLFVNDPKWPLDGLLPYISWDHMCHSTQGLLCPTLIKNTFRTCGYYLWPHFYWG